MDQDISINKVKEVFEVGSNFRIESSVELNKGIHHVFQLIPMWVPLQVPAEGVDDADDPGLEALAPVHLPDRLFQDTGGLVGQIL